MTPVDMKHPSGLVIRDYREDDHQVVVELNRYGLAAAGVPEDSDIYGGDLDDITTTYLDGSGALLVGEVAATVTAMGGLRRVNLTTCEILRMRVRPEYQGRGYGRAILQSLETRGRRLGYRTAVLVTGPDQHPAIDLYRGAGYEQTEVERFGPLVGVRLVKVLTP